MRENIKRLVAALLVVGTLGTAVAVAFAITNDDGNCHERTVAKVTARHGNDTLTVEHPPEGSVAAGGGQRITVEGHTAKLHGPGEMRVVCR